MVLLVDGFSLVHTVIYGAHKQAHNQEKDIKILSLSSNRKQLRYEDRSKIFGWFSNGTAEIILEMAWSNLEAIGGWNDRLNRGLGAKQGSGASL